MIPSPSLQQLGPNAVMRLAQSKITRVTLKQIYSIGRSVLQSKNPQARVVPAQFLHAELPVRISHNIKMLSETCCPINVSKNNAFQKMTKRYLEDVSVLTQLPKPTDKQNEREFTEALKMLKTRHRNNLFFIGQGLKELLQSTDELDTLVNDNRFQMFFDKFYAVNLGTQLLIDEQIALVDQGVNLVQKVTPYDVASQAINDALRICEAHYKTVPKVELETTNRYLSTTYVKEHLHRILFELVKYSIKCTIKSSKDQAELSSRKIKIVIAEGTEDVSIKISDQAGGHPLSENDNVWRYIRQNIIRSYTSKPFEEYKEYYDMPIDTYVHALPITRMTARYFGGDMSIYPMEGYGSDTFVYLSRTENTRENIPDDIPLNTVNFDKELKNLHRLIDRCIEVKDKDGFGNSFSK